MLNWWVNEGSKDRAPGADSRTGSRDKSGCFILPFSLGTMGVGNEEFLINSSLSASVETIGLVIGLVVLLGAFGAFFSGCEKTEYKHPMQRAAESK